VRSALAVTLFLCAACKKDTPAPPPTPPPGAPKLATPSMHWLKGELPPEKLDAPKDGGTFTMRIHIEPAGLNRLHDQMVEGTMVHYTLGPVYETLAAIDPETAPRYDLKPVLAESWSESADHLTLTIKLRHGVKFHDGQSFSARDVKAVIDTVMDPKTPIASVRSYFVDLDKVTTPDEFTVVVKWKKPYFQASKNFLGSLPMIPAAALKGNFDELPLNRHPNGTGPFKFVSWEAGKALTYERNDDYWGPKAHLAKVVIRFVKDETVATELWQRGEFDLMTHIEPSIWRSVEAPTAANQWAITGYNRIFWAENAYSYIGWNIDRPIFRDVKVRRALAMLYPFDSVEKNIDMGLEVPTTCMYYELSNSCDPSVKALPHDPKAAAALLKEAGWEDHDQDGFLDKDGERFKFSMLINVHSVRMGKVGPMLQDELKKAGIEMELERLDPTQLIPRLRAHDFDAVPMQWSNVDPEWDQYQTYHSSQAKEGSNWVSYKSPEADALMDKIRVEFDADKRASLERQVHRLLYDDQAYLYLTHRPSLDAVKTRVHGLKPAITWYDLSKVWVEP
jgi:peptide/nickel transport system substrate-binding protein